MGVRYLERCANIIANICANICGEKSENIRTANICAIICDNIGATLQIPHILAKIFAAKKQKYTHRKYLRNCLRGKKQKKTYVSLPWGRSHRFFFAFFPVNNCANMCGAYIFAFFCRKYFRKYLRKYLRSAKRSGNKSGKINGKNLRLLYGNVPQPTNNQPTNVELQSQNIS